MVLVCGTAACSPRDSVDSPSVPPAPSEVEQSSEPNQTLDLSRQILQPIADEDQALGAAEPVLPNMFEDAEDAPRVKVKGSLITDDEALELRDRIDGAQVKVEVKTQ